MFGLVFSDYSGILGAKVNPAYLSNSRVYIDVNILTADLSFQNNMYYFPSFPALFKELVSTGSINLDGGPYLYDRIFDCYDNTNPKYIYTGLKLAGPSAMIQIGQHAFGLSTSFYSVGSGNQVPYEIPVFLYEGVEYEPYQGVEFNNYNYGFASMAWMETGLSYAYNFYDRYQRKFTFGFTGKFLMGYAGGYTEIRNADFIVHNSETIEFINLDADIAYSLPIDYQTNIYQASPFFKGFGGAMDVGFMYTHKESPINSSGGYRLCAKPYDPYIFRIGLSILDLGFVQFNKRAELQNFDNVGVYWEQFDTVNFNGINHTMENLSTAFYGNPDSSLRGNNMRIGTPACLSLQFDYSFKKDFFLSGFWVQPIRFNLKTIWRPSQIALIPRYDKKIIGLSMPVSLFNYKELRLGFAVRIYSFSVGSDNLLGMFGGTDLTGMDLYFSFKFSLDKGLCLPSRRGACD